MNIKWEVNKNNGITLSRYSSLNGGWTIEEVPIYQEPSIFKIYSIPVYGGSEEEEGVKSSLKDALETVEAWT